jgi:predicted Zn-dependent peptidase
MRYENIPANLYMERLSSLFYVAHPYRNPTIGWASDIRAFTRDKLRGHVQHFYTPDNALIVLNGNIDPALARRNIGRYFGSIPPAAAKKEEVVTREPAPIGQTRFTAHLDAQPRIDIFFHTPGYPNKDLYSLDILEGVLSGRSGTLYRKLVLSGNLCTDAGAENAVRLQDGYFHVFASLKEGADPALVEKSIGEEFSRLMKEPPTDNEMLRVKNTIRMSFVSELKSLEGLSDQLAWYERLGNWRDLLAYPKRIAAVNKSDVPAVATRYLDMAKATIGLLDKDQTPAAAPAPASSKPDRKKK